MFVWLLSLLQATLCSAASLILGSQEARSLPCLHLPGCPLEGESRCLNWPGHGTCPNHLLAGLPSLGPLQALSTTGPSAPFSMLAPCSWNPLILTSCDFLDLFLASQYPHSMASGINLSASRSRYLAGHRGVLLERMDVVWCR